MYPLIYRTIRLFYPGGFETRRLLNELEQSQWLPEEELVSRQLARLQQLVKHAYEQVPYYHDLYQSLDIHPEDIKTMQDFEALPLLTKEDVVNNADRLIASNFPRNRLQVIETGGSTGMPLRCFIDQSYWHWLPALEMRGHGWHGVSEGEKIAWIAGTRIKDLENQGWKERLKVRITQQRYLNPICLTKARMQAFAELLVRWQPSMILAYPSALSLFARHLRENGIGGIRPKLIEVTSEKVTPSQRQLLEEVFQCRVIDAYGSRELGPLAFECEAGGLHVTEGCHLEAVANGRPVEPGQIGELVLTSLHQYGMPLIRYRIFDMGIYETHPCSCGRGLPILREVVGRTSSFIVTSDGQYTDGSFFEYTFQVKPEITRYQIYQPDLDRIEVRLVLRQEVDQPWLDCLRRELQAPFDSRLQITLRCINEISLTSSGKLLSVISDVQPDFI